MTFKPNSLGLGELLRSEAMKQHVKDRAEKIAAAARAASPSGPLTDEERTRYRDAWEVTVDEKVGESGFGPNVRARATVSNQTPYAAAVEFGNGRTQPAKRQRKTIEPHYTLTRAIDAARE